MNDFSCVGHLSSANTATNVPTVVINPPVGARLQQFWEKWEALGSSPIVVTILREGYTLPFRFRPILDLSTLNTFLNTESFKMETPETIRTSLQIGEWVTSIDFKDVYFHIPIHSQFRKYMRFHIQGQSYQFKVLPFGLSTIMSGPVCPV